MNIIKKIKKLITASLIALVIGMNVGILDFNSSEPKNSHGIIPHAQAQDGEELTDDELTEEIEEFEPEESDLTLDEFLDLQGSADDEGPKTIEGIEELLNDVTKKSAKAHYIFSPLINLASFHIGSFLGTDYIFEGAMGDMLKKIWVISRNLVNIGFVFILLWLALKTIVWPEATIDDLKKKLLTFTILLVVVNFSWLATKLVLDSANVITHIVFAIPSGISDPVNFDSPTGFEPCKVNANETEDGTGAKTTLSGQCYPTAIYAPADAALNSDIIYWQDKDGDGACADLGSRYEGRADSAYFDGKINTNASPDNKDLQRRTSMCMESINLFKFDQNTAVPYLTYGSARIQNLTRTTTNSSNLIKTATSILIPLAIQAAYAIALFALLFALVVRMMMLWILVGFSPFLVMAYWFKDSESVSEVKEYFSIEQFINWAFVPAKVGAIFVISFIMISAGQSLGSSVGSWADNSDFVFKLLDQRSIFGNLDSIQYIVWLLMSLATLWLGTFAVLSKLKFVNTVTDAVGSAGRTFASQVATLPYWAPILPIGQNGEKTSIRSTVKAVSPISGMNKFYNEANGAGVQPDINLEKKAVSLNNSDVNGILGMNASASQESQRIVANRFAKRLGFELKGLMNLGDSTVKKALEKNDNISSEQAQKIVSHLQTINNGGRVTNTTPPATQTPKPVTPPASEKGKAAE